MHTSTYQLFSISRGVSAFVQRCHRNPEQTQRCFWVHLLCCIALNSDCWSKKEDTHGVYGVAHDLTLNQCFEACINDITCVAIDWEPSNAGKTCWILTLTYEMPTTEIGVITHYILSRSCLGEYYFWCTVVLRMTWMAWNQMFQKEHKLFLQLLITTQNSAEFLQLQITYHGVISRLNSIKIVLMKEVNKALLNKTVIEDWVNRIEETKAFVNKEKIENSVMLDKARIAVWKWRNETYCRCLLLHFVSVLLAIGLNSVCVYTLYRIES